MSLILGIELSYYSTTGGCMPVFYTTYNVGDIVMHPYDFTLARIFFC